MKTNGDFKEIYGKVIKKYQPWEGHKNIFNALNVPQLGQSQQNNTVVS